MIINQYHGSYSIGSEDPLDLSGWKKLPTHPGKLSKSDPNRPEKRTVSGYKGVQSFYRFGDLIFIGHGDLNANDGRTDIVALNVKTHCYEVVLRRFDSESVSVFYENDGVLYVLASDPLGYWGEYLPYATFPPQDTAPIEATHITSIQIRDGIIYLGTSRYSVRDNNEYEIPYLVVSKDKGKTWESFEVPDLSFKYGFVFNLKWKDDLLLIRTDAFSYDFSFDGTKISKIDSIPEDTYQGVSPSSVGFVDVQGIAYSDDDITIVGLDNGDIWMKTS